MREQLEIPWAALPDAPSAPIRIVGLGPGSLGDLTLAAWQTLAAAPRIVARTLRHPCLEPLAARLPITGCDDLYETHDHFADVYAAVAQRVVSLGREPGGVVYAVPGHPWVGETTTRLILEQAAAAGLEVAVIGGISFIEASLGAVGVDVMDGGQVLDAMLLAKQHHPQVEVGLPLLVGQLYSRPLASDVKLTLLNAYPDEHPVTVIRAAGTPHQQTDTRLLYTLDHQDGFDHLTSLYVPPLHWGDFTDLQELVAHLRAPEGCPWDQEQTLESLRSDLLGECVEVLEAIDLDAHLAQEGGNNHAHLAEEIGDLYLVTTMLVQIATEEGSFRMADIMDHLIAKLIRRHPHVFGDVEVENIDHLLRNWDAIKAEEKAAKGQAAGHALDGVPAALPALAKARKLQSKAAKAGLLDRAALADQLPANLLGDNPTATRLGELLWRLVAVAHRHDIDPEDALRAYTVSFRAQHDHRD
jgi:tetrapyrrole methylase family protein / MazG family protein